LDDRLSGKSNLFPAAAERPAAGAGKIVGGIMRSGLRPGPALAGQLHCAAHILELWKRCVRPWEHRRPDLIFAIGDSRPSSQRKEWPSAGEKAARGRRRSQAGLPLID